MSLTVAPGHAEGAVSAPGSKSVTHRGLFLTLVAGGGTVEAPLWSRDTRASLDAIRAYGAKTVATTDEVVVRGARPGPAELDAENSGTTLRIATAIAALADGTTRLAGDDSLNQRPIGPLADALTQLGATVEYEGDEGTPPLRVTGPVEGGSATVDASGSSQYVTALLLAALRMPDGLDLTIKGELASKPYVDLTCSILEAAGVDLDREPSRFTVPGQDLRPVHVDVPGDYSTAAFPLVAGAMTGGPITVTNLPTDTAQGDQRVADLVEAFGASVEREADTLTVEGPAETPASLDLADNPDLFPPLAALAATVDGTTELTGAPHLRDKESDRIDAMVEGLTALGVDVEALEGGARITGGQPTGGTVDSRGDHRIQMAFAVLGLAAQDPVTVTGPTEAHEVSYPRFVQDLRALGADVQVEAEGDAKQPESREGSK